VVILLENPVQQWHSSLIVVLLTQTFKRKPVKVRRMNESGTERTSSKSVASTGGKTRLSGSRLIIARVVWLALVLPSVGLFVASLPVYYTFIQKACTDPVTCNIAGALTAKGLQELPTLGLSAASYAALLIIFFTIQAAIWCGVGFLVFWRRSDEWFALVTALFLVMFSTTYPGFPISALQLAFPALTAPITFMSVLALASLALFLMLFPNGRLISRWMLPFLLLLMINTISTAIPPSSLFGSNNLPAWIPGLSNILTFGAVIFSQIYRYRRVSTRIERQQTKWVIFGILIVLVGISAVPPIFNFFFPVYFSQPDIPSSVFLGLVNYPIILLSLPVTIGIAVLRSRLYDIDVVINRTLVYGSLTLLLALVYFGLIFGSQFLFQGMFHQTNAIALVISTLVIYALFQPLRRRIQAIIDRRFYRRKYDAAHTLAAFSATLRSEVDLNQLHEHLLAVVEETMQPTHVSLWLCPTGQEKIPTSARARESWASPTRTL
jgi:hypothetical protein